MARGAETIVAALEAAGVRVCFGLPGVHNLPLWEALRGSSIRLVGVRHEQAAVYAADGYARATGALGVAVVTTGPGAANTAGAMGEAWASRSALLLIATDIPTALRRPGIYRGALHETPDQGSLFASITVARRRVASPEDLPATVADAVAAPAALRRPVYLEVPTDLLQAAVPDDAVTPTPPASTEAPTPEDVERAAALIDRAARPLVWAGAGARDAGEAVGRLAERLAAPVLTTYGARGVLPPAHPCAVGFPAHVPAVGSLWDEADAVIAVGSDLDGMNTQNWAQPQPPTLVAVNVDAADATKNYRVDAVLTADADAGCRALADAVAPRASVRSLQERLRTVRADACRDLDEDGLRFLDAVAHALPPDAVVLADMCIPGYWLAGFRTFAAPRRLQYPVGWGTLGYAFPASLGAALADAGGPVVSFSGDGGFLFACGELATVAQEDLPLTAVVIDDGGYGMLRHDQDRHGVPHHGVDLRTPDFAALAASFGIRATTVDGLDDAFGDALAAHVEDPRPSLLAVRAASLRPPPTTSPEWYRRRAGR